MQVVADQPPRHFAGREAVLRGMALVRLWLAELIPRYAAYLAPAPGLDQLLAGGSLDYGVKIAPGGWCRALD